MKNNLNVFFIHHGSINGGAPLSMFYTIKALEPFGYNFKIGLVSKSIEVKKFFQNNGYKTIDTSWIKLQTLCSAFDKPFFHHSNLKSWFNVIKNKKTIRKNINQLYYDENIDIIHLNSVVFSPLVEILLKDDMPFIWHIRESAPQRNRGYRFKKIVSLMLNSKHLIFLSEEEKKSWLGNINHGIIVNNFVDFNYFNSKGINLTETRSKYKILPDDFVVLFLGGFKNHKGPDLLIEALNILINIKGIKNIKCLMPDTVVSDIDNNTTAIYKIKQIIKKLLKKNNTGVGYYNFLNRMIRDYSLNNYCIQLPFNPYTKEMYAISNVVVFPAKVPHFARPIIEAGAMGKPVIASNLPILTNLVINNKTGIIFDLTPTSIANAIEKLYNNKKLCTNMGISGKKQALERFNAEKQIKLIYNIYKDAIKNI